MRAPAARRYSRRMTAPAPKPHGLALAFSPARLRFTLRVSAGFGVFLWLLSEAPFWMVMSRALTVGLGALAAFGLFEQWPAKLPRWLERWVLQLLGVFSSVPFSGLFAYWYTTGGHPDFANEPKRIMGWGMLTFVGMLFGPWLALGAMLKQRDAFARTQALAFELERSRLERQAMDARMRLLQAQVQPHFLFNTLANVQALVDAGSPQASALLKSLTAYLRAAVPRLDAAATTLGRELELARAYLELMHARMPDRLRWSLHVDAAARDVECPPLTLLTLVENAVKHGIDPGEEGGTIEVEARVREGRCIARVTDTGVGLQAAGGGLGTGLSTLRERLQLAFGGDARLRLTEVQPHGVCAEVEFPVRIEAGRPPAAGGTMPP